MSQLVIKPWRLAPLGIDAPSYVFGAAVRPVQQIHQLVAPLIAAIGRISGRLREPRAPFPGLEPPLLRNGTDVA